MALVTCHECGNEISTQAKLCPKCGAPVKAKQSVGFGTVVVVALGVLLLLISIFPNSNHVPEIPLQAIVSHFAGRFEITNNDNYRWGNCDLDLNSDYSMKGINVEANETITVMAANFTKQDGTRFNILTTKPLKLFIYCRDTPNSRSTLVVWK